MVVLPTIKWLTLTSPVPFAEVTNQTADNTIVSSGVSDSGPISARKLAGNTPAALQAMSTVAERPAATTLPLVATLQIEYDKLEVCCVVFCHAVRFLQSTPFIG